MTKNKTKECKFCKTEIPKGATICPNCKKDLRDFAWKHPMVTTLLIIFIIAMFWWQFIEEENIEITNWSCSSEMKKEVANEYKSPSTVKFISCNWNKNKWIFWEADAENWFWWTIRSSFLCNWNSCIITQK